MEKGKILTLSTNQKIKFSKCLPNIRKSTSLINVSKTQNIYAADKFCIFWKAFHRCRVEDAHRYMFKRIHTIWTQIINSVLIVKISIFNPNWYGIFSINSIFPFYLPLLFYSIFYLYIFSYTNARVSERKIS